MTEINNIDITDLSDDDLLQIEMAAKGCISGALVEWPRLRLAFDRLGLDSSGDMRSEDVREICRGILKIIQN